ncbi:hypothetical protein BHE74_00027180 [Ensete ventricosum]|nr:hypothetical protein BHE74_00027180 [Ensete ventricosum]
MKKAGHRKRCCFLSLCIRFSFLCFFASAGKGFDGRVFGDGFLAKLVAMDIFVGDEALNLILSAAALLFNLRRLWLLLHVQTDGLVVSCGDVFRCRDLSSTKSCASGGYGGRTRSWRTWKRLRAPGNNGRPRRRGVVPSWSKLTSSLYHNLNPTVGIFPSQVCI